MKCPACSSVDLKMSERQGVEIDYCPQCRGVWLDRGELDKIIEKATPGDQRDSFAQDATRNTRSYRDDDDDDDNRFGRRNGRRRREGFLGDLFDF